MSYFFNSKRYISSGVAKILSTDLQQRIWILLPLEGSKENIQKFLLLEEVVDGITYQRIVHTQNTSSLEFRYLCKEGRPVSDITVWVVDETDHVIMLLPSEV